MNRREILRLLRRAGGDLRAAEAEMGESEALTADPTVQSECSDDEMPERERDRRERYYLRCSMDEASDDELWRHLHHGRPSDSNSPRDQRSYTDLELQWMMRETNDILRGRINRLRHELEAASLVNNVPAMDAIESQIFEAQNLMYSI